MIILRIYTDASICTGCKTCELACYFSKSNKFNPKKARIRVVRDLMRGVDTPLVCKQCVNPPCMKACPEGALIKDADEGVIRVIEEVCTGCGLCVKDCVISVISLDPETRKPLICDLCNGKPVCVSWCPTGALSLIKVGR